MKTDNKFNLKELYMVAHAQKTNINLVVYKMLAIILFVFMDTLHNSIGILFSVVALIVIEIFQIIYIFKLSKSIKINPWTRTTLIVIFDVFTNGLIGIILWAMLINTATKVLKLRGFDVGFMGVTSKLLQEMERGSHNT